MKRKTTSRKGKEKARKIEKPPDKVDVNPSSCCQQNASEVRDKTSHTVQDSTDLVGNTSPTQQSLQQDQQCAAAGDASEYNIDKKACIPGEDLSGDVDIYHIDPNPE